MKIFMLLMTVFLIKVSASESFAQKITLHKQHTPLKEIFAEIKRQTGYTVFYRSEHLKNTKPVTVTLDQVSLEEAFTKILEGQDLEFAIDEKTIVITEKEKTIVDRITDFFDDGGKEGKDVNQDVLRGRVLSEDNKPLPGATVRITKTNITTFTDREGRFTLRNVPEDASLSISYVGFETLEVKAADDLAALHLTPLTSTLEEVMVDKGYYTTSKKLNTGNVSTVTAADIDKQPVRNPLMALEGRVPGLTIASAGYAPGANVLIRIRGNASLSQGTEPLYIIDGVPFDSSVRNNNLGANGSNQSAFNSISPSDIERIDILKDADATAVYGSRGANGVILITTKRGKVGDLKVDVNLIDGFSKISSLPDYLNTQQYLDMRQMAFKNDGIVPTKDNAPDLMVWDQNRYVDWAKVVIGRTSSFTNSQVSISGGSSTTQFLIGAAYNRVTPPYDGDFSDQRTSVHSNITVNSNDRRFNALLTSSYSIDNNTLPGQNLMKLLFLPPNAPAFKNPDGSLNFYTGINDGNNPYSLMMQKYAGTTKSLLSNVSLNYAILPNLKATANLGYTNNILNEYRLIPLSSLNPANNSTGNSVFGYSSSSTWIVEPQLQYTKNICNSHHIDALLGATFSQNLLEGSRENLSGFPSDLQLEDKGAATSSSLSNTFSKYRYAAVFARIGYNFEEKYVLNLTARRDGSSRFGPDNRFSNFGAVGASWVLSEEPFIKERIKFISFAKLRGSYGITGNDQIGDYMYLDTYGSVFSSQYLGISLLQPSKLYNAEYGWEGNKKLEAALELGFLKDRIMLETSLFRNRSSNSLLNYDLSAVTGFPSVLLNFPATVQNEGFEIVISSKNIASGNFNWTTDINFSRIRNSLISFPNLERSSYGQQYTVGSSLNSSRAYKALGVDPETGRLIFEKADGTVTNSPDYAADRISSYDVGIPKFSGGIDNALHYKNFDLAFLFQFVKQDKYNPVFNNGTGQMFGSMNNIPVYALAAWRRQGDVTNIPKYTTQSTDYFSATGSDLNAVDGSFIRLKNVSLSFTLDSQILQRLKVSRTRIYLQGQNLFNITKYKGTDPEGFSGYGNGIALPPSKILTAGLELTF